jgi:hypothetical protein
MSQLNAKARNEAAIKYKTKVRTHPATNEGPALSQWSADYPLLHARHHDLALS